MPLGKVVRLALPISLQQKGSCWVTHYLLPERLLSTLLWWKMSSIITIYSTSVKLFVRHHFTPNLVKINILQQTMPNTDNMIILEIFPSAKESLSSQEIPGMKYVCTVCNWIRHLQSDLNCCMGLNKLGSTQCLIPKWLFLWLFYISKKVM